MQALLFEVEPRAGHAEHYFNHAARLRPLLDAHDGLLFLDRYESLRRPGVYLSHSMWRDEAAIARWRTDATHYKTQAAGRNVHFKDYRLRISHVILHQRRGEAPRTFATEGSYRTAADARFVAIISAEGKPFEAGGEAFRSRNDPDSYITIIAPGTEAEGRDILAAAAGAAHVTVAMLAVVSRDYGMFDRAEAPQYFAPLPNSDEP